MRYVLVERKYTNKRLICSELFYQQRGGEGAGMNYTVLKFVLETGRITALKAHTVNCTDCDKSPGLARYPNQLTVPNWSHVMSADTLA